MVSMNVFIIMMHNHECSTHGTYKLNGKLNFLQFGTEGGREDGWMEGIYAHHDIIHYNYNIFY